MAEPRLLLLDEPSLGLAPKIIVGVFETIVGIAAMDIGILIVEQPRSTGYVVSGTSPATTRCMLDVKALTRNFGGLRAIDDRIFSVQEGEFCGIIGPNGLDGRDITGLRPYHVCGLGIARTFQITRPFNEMTVEENIMAGFLFSGRTPRGLSDARASCRALAELVGLEGKLLALGATLTLGEKKRLELARSLATRPKLLLLDEVMGGLSQQEIADIVLVLKRVQATGTTVIIIAHVLHALMQLVDRIVVPVGLTALDHERYLVVSAS
jgi:branched-chain amino acid transport system ATP-binding protein